MLRWTKEEEKILFGKFIEINDMAVAAKAFAVETGRSIEGSKAKLKSIIKDKGIQIPRGRKVNTRSPRQDSLAYDPIGVHPRTIGKRILAEIDSCSP